VRHLEEMSPEEDLASATAAFDELAGEMQALLKRLRKLVESS